MKGGTLMISRCEENHGFYKKRMEELGFSNVTVTAAERDALNSEIYDLNPSLVIMGARFYHGCTPFMMGELRKLFPKIKMASFVIGEYPPELAMYFILNGVNSYVTSFDGLPTWYKGLNEVCNGREFVSPEVLRRIDMRQEKPMPAKVTARHKEIIRLLCNGWKDLEIAETLNISRCTVSRHKCDILTSLNVRSVLELVHVALTTGMVTLDELCFRPSNIVLNPVPEIKIKGRSRG
jgi:DNA-binding NarL/FixJ family response regulator